MKKLAEQIAKLYGDARGTNWTLNRSNELTVDNINHWHLDTTGHSEIISGVVKMEDEDENRPYLMAGMELVLLLQNNTDKIVKALEYWDENHEPETTIRVGQRYIGGITSACEKEFMIACIATGEVCFMNVSTGYRWTESIKVSDVLKITEEELDMLKGSGSFTLKGEWS